MTVIQLRRCKPEFDRDRGADPDGSLAREGRATLRADLTAPSASGGCDCARCAERARPFSALEAETVLSHVTDRQAVAYALGTAVLGGCVLGCESCGGWVPSFHTAPGALTAGA